MKVFVAGGSGFVGRSLCRVLDERGHNVTAASRNPDASELPASVETTTLDVRNPDLSDVVAGHDAVVNLVALPSHSQLRNRSHEAVHLGGTKHLVAASEATGVERFVQMSGLGVDSGVQTTYFRAKRRAERVVRESALDWVIYRPSVVFGDGCAFVPFIEQITPPVVAPLPGGGTMRMQPIWVEDLAPMFADGVEEARHAGKIYEIGGPEKPTFAEIIEAVCDGVTVVSVPMSVASVGFSIAERAPGVPFGRDQYRVLRHDNTTETNDVAVFGVAESDLRTFGAYLQDKK
ncbi:NADH dehydrogenase [Haladaptatus litoreus]|uniref:NADH dehydrogenase n=1 Tax=Haladaptatus litoreus TaxID=553468 RepID=A0A1N6XDU1_9EURY|nr:complex I NDUFA9 subunit family protein [Haladaptatus litoreus]SIR00483.1 NADH dehydrogenase [Haladaptatus litoreus]